MEGARYRFSKGHGELVVLGLLTKGPMHGYQIFQTLCEPERRAVYILCMGEGTLYPLLYRMEKKGLIGGRWVKVADKRKQRQYRITKKGGQEYRRIRRCWTALMTAVNKICGGA